MKGFIEVNEFFYRDNEKCLYPILANVNHIAFVKGNYLCLSVLNCNQDNFSFGENSVIRCNESYCEIIEKIKAALEG